MPWVSGRSGRTNPPPPPECELTTIHAKEMAKYEKAYPPTQFELGDRVWVRNLPKSEDKNFKKLERIWTKPYEIMEVVGAHRYRIATSSGPKVLGIERLKRAFPLLNGTKLKVEHHAPRPAPDHDDTWVVEDVHKSG